MNIGYATPNSGNYLQILPSINVHFADMDDPEISANTLAAIEIGWLGWSLWFELLE